MKFAFAILALGILATKPWKDKKSPQATINRNAGPFGFLDPKSGPGISAYSC